MASSSDYLSRTKRQYLTSLILMLLAANVILIASWITLKTYLHLNDLGYSIALLGVALVLSFSLAIILSNHLIAPLRALWQLVINITPAGGLPPPNIDQLKIGRELVADLSAKVLQLTMTVANAPNQPGSELSVNFVANNLPLPLFVLDPVETIVFANVAAGKYIGISTADMIGKNFYMVLDMSFPSENTFERWLKQVKTSSATATMSWERVRLNVLDNHPTLLFDLAAYYNKDNPEHYETMAVLFDHTKQYSQDDQAVSFVALSVHELRTPLTLLRGYIEALEDETKDLGNSDLSQFIEKMNATAQQLSVFVNNILNVARVDNDQLQLSLNEENWRNIVVDAVNAISLRAKVRGITIETNIAPNLPSVGVDHLSIYEVINNLLDNAIKYSGSSKVIKVDAHLSKEGLVETTVQDFGLGISPSIMPNLFTKFYRDHHNRSQIGGTGLGLYLAKAIVNAHGGNIWVRSKLGEGSVFGFSIQPYASLAADNKNSDNKEITRGAHGWIKNHSLYRR
ncbi:PAS domain-containing sensor histidine kinase [Patescibacteria group bacterium]|jgi:signal transduction histidine kinase|nr:PAS domain-containing sensor histidine kinase [Patescibacteria group bacterium]